MKSHILKTLTSVLILLCLSFGYGFAENTEFDSTQLNNDITVVNSYNNITFNFTIDDKEVVADEVRTVWTLKGNVIDQPVIGTNYITLFVRKNDKLSCYGQEVDIREGVNRINFDSSLNETAKIIWDTVRQYDSIKITMDSCDGPFNQEEFSLKAVNFISYPKDKGLCPKVELINEKSSLDFYVVSKNVNGKFENIYINDKLNIRKHHGVNQIGSDKFPLSSMFWINLASGQYISITSDIKIKVFSDEKCIIEGLNGSEKVKKAIKSLPIGNYTVQADLTNFGLGVEETTYTIGEKISVSDLYFVNQSEREFLELSLIANGKLMFVDNHKDNLYGFTGFDLTFDDDYFVKGDNEIIISNFGFNEIENDAICKYNINFQEDGYAVLKYGGDNQGALLTAFYDAGNIKYTLDGSEYIDTENINYVKKICYPGEEKIDQITFSKVYKGTSLLILKDNDEIENKTIIKEVTIKDNTEIDLDSKNMIEVIPNYDNWSDTSKSLSVEYKGYDTKISLNKAKKNLISDIDYSSIEVDVKRDSYCIWKLKLNNSNIIKFDNNIVYDKEVQIASGDEFSLLNQLNFRDGYGNKITSLLYNSYIDSQANIYLTLNSQDSIVSSYSMSLDDINTEIGNLPVGDYTLDLYLSPFEIGLIGTVKLTITDGDK